MTQVETRLMVEKVQNRLKPVITHDMHQQGTDRVAHLPAAVRRSVRSQHPSDSRGGTGGGRDGHGHRVDIAQGKEGIEQTQRYDLWTPARQYMVYHGQPRILTEIASANLADPFVNRGRTDRPDRTAAEPLELPQALLQRPMASRRHRRLRDDRGPGRDVARGEVPDRVAHELLPGSPRLGELERPPHAFVVPAGQRDPLATYQLLEILKTGEVELLRARAAFDAGGASYPAGTVVVKLAQPYGAFAKTLLERQRYPDLRLFPGGPPKPPYDVTGHTLGMLMGVTVEQIDAPFDAALDPVTTLTPEPSVLPPPPGWGYVVPPESNAGFKLLARLQAATRPGLPRGRGIHLRAGIRAGRVADSSHRHRPTAGRRRRGDDGAARVRGRRAAARRRLAHQARYPNRAACAAPTTCRAAG